MAACCLMSVPEDILLHIARFLQPEDLLPFVQTCKTLYSLTAIKAFWICCAKTLQRRRRVHYLPLEELDIPQLRKSIFHTLKLDLKWSGREHVDPSPVRCTEICPGWHASGLPTESQAVTWVWFLEDGVHLTCIVGDTVVQLWNLPGQRLLLSFHMGGTLVRASQYSDKNYFIMVGSVNVAEGPHDGRYGAPVHFKVWKYDWRTTGVVDQLAPLAVVPLPTHPCAIFVSEAIAGVVYVTNKAKEIPPDVEKDKLGYLTFHVVEWKEPCRTLRRFTPLSFFGETRANMVKSNLAHCDRTSSHFIISFESTPIVDVYLYDMHRFNTFSRPQCPSWFGDSHPEIVHPRLKALYTLNAQDAAPWLSGSIRQSWSQSCLLWDNYRMGILGFNVTNEDGRRRAVLSLSVLDLSPLFTHDEQSPTHDLQGEYRRHLLNRESKNLFYTTQNNRLLGNLPQHGTNNIWALGQLEAPNALAELVLGRFSPADGSQTATHVKPVNETLADSTDGRDQCAADDQHGNSDVKQTRLLPISLTPWIPSSEQAEDLDLDDRLGRVALGMVSGKAYILEFI